MAVHLHLLNARGRLNPLRERIERVFWQGVDTIAALLPIGKIDVVVQTGPFVILETGMTGYSRAADVLEITIDPNNTNLLHNFDTELLATLGHEFHHCLRHDGPGYGQTLGEALVSEGLACHFETELRGGMAPFYARFLDQEASEAMWARALPELHNFYNHRAWFFGSAEQNIPRFTGYSLGYNLVATYIKAAGTPASQLWNTPAEVIYAGLA
ncbi:MAG: DUF2268 domain-containing protein [Chloroflexaceae bacterium]|jgi:uncharacterized protein YjaZ|nr:DUF2268 domain-containing protein [Chloroflexaceae bacterium]